MVSKTTMASLVLALTLPFAAIADAPHKAGGNAVRTSAPPSVSQTPPHHKVRCCSGRMQAQPHPTH